MTHDTGIGEQDVAGTREGVGILGGTFDPLHLGHLVIAEEARTRLGLTEVVFVPAGGPYHRGQQPVAASKHRLAMVRLGVAGNPRFRVSTMDIEREGPSYSIDSVRQVREEAGPGTSLVFIMGWDALRELQTWRQPDLLLSLCRVAAARRPDTPDLDWRLLEQAVPDVRDRIVQLDTPLIGISATEVRRRVAEGVSIRYWVPDAVAEYITEHRLYQGARPPQSVL